MRSGAEALGSTPLALMLPFVFVLLAAWQFFTMKSGLNRLPEIADRTSTPEVSMIKLVLISIVDTAWVIAASVVAAALPLS